MKAPCGDLSFADCVDEGELIIARQSSTIKEQ
jgi:hypothetical protein